MLLGAGSSEILNLAAMAFTGPALPHHLRVTIGTAEQMQAFLAAFGQVTAGSLKSGGTAHMSNK